MPTRIIRESMLDSHRYASLGDPAKLLFVHLLLLADDFGCIAISPTFLRRRAFYNSPTNEHIAKMIAELVDADLIRCYEADGAHLAFIPRFRQRLQRNSLKHTAPPESLLHGDDHAIGMFNKIKEVTKNTTVGQQGTTVVQQREVEVEVEVKRSEKPKVKNTSRATRLSISEIPEDWILWAKTERPDLTPERVFEQFHDYWIGVGGSKGCKLDWFATWRNWCRQQRAVGGAELQTRPKAPSASMQALMAMETAKRGIGS